MTYGILLGKYLAAITLHDPKRALRLSLELFNNYQYRLPFFQRLVLHNLSLHFESQRGLLKQLFAPLDPHGIFDDYTYRPDLFNLLRNNQDKFNASEIKLLSAIIDAGPSREKHKDESQKSYWRFRWYVALNQISPFRELYKTVGESHALRDRDVDPTQNMRFRSGTVPPMTTIQLLAMADEEIVGYLLAFNPKDRWEEPNISGLANILQQAVIEQPIRFTSSLNLYLEVPYIYAYHLLYGLLEKGRKSPGEADWPVTANFCRDYMQQADFDQPMRLLHADSWHADKHWVLGVIANLVSEICKHDAIVNDHLLLPVCRDILFAMRGHLVTAAPAELQNLDYPSHSLNSNNGKFFRACLDYCLCVNRVAGRKPPVFPAEISEIFDNGLGAQDMDAFILLGFNLQIFNYLDPAWFVSKLKVIMTAEELNWKAFMGGFLFTVAPGTKPLLSLTLPNYGKAIDQRLELKTGGTNGLAVHLASLYFWGLVDLGEKSVLRQYLLKMPTTAINDLLHAMFFSEGYVKSLRSEKRLKLENKVVDLIDLLHEVYGNSTEPEILDMLRSTVNIIYLIRGFNERNTAIIKKAIVFGTKQYHHSDLFGRFHEMMEIGEPSTSAAFLGEILEQITFTDNLYVIDEDRERLKKMVQFLYNHQQRSVADTLCNRLSKVGQIFAKDLFLDNNR
jgi:hypothetical protein